MKSGRLFLAGVFSIVGVTSAESREASLAHFDSPPVPAIHIAGAREVAESLLSHMRSLGPIDQPNLFESQELARTPNQIQHGRVQRHLGARQSIKSFSIQASLSVGTLEMHLPCEAGSYAPTWWLSPAVEVRRAAHFSTVASIACEFGMSAQLLDAVIAQESGYKAWAVSGAGAMGMMQIMPGTARLLGLATPFDPVANLRAGARYLRQQLDRFGRIDLALAAYNAGPERRSLQRGHVPAIPETLSYVHTITTNWARLSELENGDVSTADRTLAALSAVRASGYRDVELIRYDGLN